MDDRLIKLEARFKAILPTLATKADIESLRADVKKWMAGTIIGLIVGFGGLLMTITTVLRPEPAQQPQAPVIITIPVPAAAK